MSLKATSLRALTAATQQGPVVASQAPAAKPAHSPAPVLDTLDFQGRPSVVTRPMEGFVPLVPSSKPTKRGLATKWSEVKKGRKGDAPTDGLWYRFKRQVLNILCNIDLTFLRRKSFKDGAPAEVKAALQPGDILLRRTDFTSGNYFNPSWWKHAAVYTGKDGITEAAFKGLRTVTVDDFFKHGDDVMVLRLKDLKPEQQKAIADYALAQVGKPYDFDVDFVDEGRMSCTELAYQALQAATGRDPVGMGTFGEVTGDRFMNPNFDLLWTSNPAASGVVEK